MDRAVTPKRKTARGRAGSKHACVALQGGGSHGALTWGVLDRLLEDGRIEFDAVSGSSAGAINGALLVHGLEIGGRDAARAKLGEFWERVGNASVFGPLNPSWLGKLMETTGLDVGANFPGFDALFRTWSPYQLNPFNYNPLRNMLLELIEFERLQKGGGPRLFVGATDVRAGRLKIFETEAVTVDVLLASTCLPFLFQAVEIDGVAYWDGGYLGNPPLTPMIAAVPTNDLILVPINPLRREELPTSAMSILDRINEISFNAAFLSELNAIELINGLIARNEIDPGTSRLREIYLHRIGDEEAMANYSASSKLYADAGLIQSLFELGRAAATQFLETRFDDLGRRSSFSIAEKVRPAAHSHAG